MSLLLLLLLLTVVLLVTAIVSFPFHKISNRLLSFSMIVTPAYNFSVEGSKCFLFNPGRIYLRIFILILLFLMGGMEA